jgi:hypothetical protein
MGLNSKGSESCCGCRTTTSALATPYNAEQHNGQMPQTRHSFLGFPMKVFTRFYRGSKAIAH